MTQTTTPPVPQATIVMSADDLHNPAVLRRFWKYVHKTDTCWLWTGSKTGEGGYGRFFVNRRMCLAHRFAYELLVGPIPVGLELDHVRARGCTNRHCVRVDHLEPVTRRENLLRGNGAPARNARLTHCKQGHPFDEENTLFLPNGKGRACRACKAIASARRAHPRPPKTHCKHGHPFDEENTYRRTSQQGRDCRTCRALAQARRAHPRPPATHCKNGHPVTPETSYVHGGARHCVVCRRQAWMRAYWRRRGTEAA